MAVLGDFLGFGHRLEIIDGERLLVLGSSPGGSDAAGQDGAGVVGTEEDGGAEDHPGDGGAHEDKADGDNALDHGLEVKTFLAAEVRVAISIGVVKYFIT